MTEPTIPAGHQGPHTRERWRPIKNMEPYKTIPSFGMVMLKPTDGDDFFTHEALDGQLVHRGWQCTAEGEALGQPYMFLLNSGVPIPPGQIGKATQDWPALALHDGSHDRLPNGAPCGPVDGSWYVWSTGRGFINQSHDVCGAYPPTKGVHGVRIAPGNAANLPAGLVTGGGVVSAGGTIGSSTATLALEIAAASAFEWDASLTKWAIYQPGIYMVSVSATVNASLTVAEETVLRLSVKATVEGNTTTRITGHRLQSIDTIGPGSPYYGGAAYPLAENIAFAHPVEITVATPTRPAYIWLINDSSVAMTVADVYFSAFPIAFTRSASGSLVYDDA